MKPTLRLRLFSRLKHETVSGKDFTHPYFRESPVLQQWWEDGDKGEWRDVPLEHEPHPMLTPPS